MFVMNNGTLLAVKLKGRRVFQMLSSVHSVVDVELGQNHPGTGHPITKPEIIHDYNKFMGAVDRCDQMVAYSCFRRRTMRWWKKKFFHLFFLDPECLHSLQAKSLVTCVAKDLSKGTLEGVC